METTTRKTAGKALMLFLLVMAALTLLSNTLKEMVVPVVTMSVPQRGALEHRVNADGTLSAQNIVAITPDEAARVVEIYAKAGQKLAAGDAIMLLDYTDVLKGKYNALVDALYQMVDKKQAYDWAVADISKDSVRTLEERRERLLAAEAKRDKAREALDELIEKGGDENQIEKAESQLKSAQSTVDTQKRSLDQITSSREYIKANVALEQAQKALNDAWRAYFAAYAKLDMALPEDQWPSRETVLRAISYGESAAEWIAFDPDEMYTSTLRAEIIGEVLEINAKVGENLNTTGPALTLGDLSRGLNLTLTVSSSDAERIEVGDTAEVEIGDERVNCPITSVRASTAASGSYEVELSIPNGYGAIGLRASMRFSKKTANYDILVPLDALHEDGQGEYVYVVETEQSSFGTETKVRRVDVYSLDKDATRAAIQSGLSSRDVLALRSDRALSDGDRVRLEEE